jgi:hypothetical protein
MVFPSVHVMHASKTEAACRGVSTHSDLNRAEVVYFQRQAAPFLDLLPQNGN